MDSSTTPPPSHPLDTTTAAVAMAGNKRGTAARGRSTEASMTAKRPRKSSSTSVTPLESPLPCATSAQQWCPATDPIPDVEHVQGFIQFRRRLRIRPIDVDIGAMNALEVINRVAAELWKTDIAERGVAEWRVWLYKKYCGHATPVDARSDGLPDPDDMIEVPHNASIHSLLGHCVTLGKRDNTVLVNLLIAAPHEVEIRNAYLRFKGQTVPFGKPKPTPGAKGELASILVNRVVETFDLLMTWLHTTHTMHNYIVPVLPQMSGMGKTAFALLFQQVMTREPETDVVYREELVNLLKTANSFSKGLIRSLSPSEEADIVRDTSKSVLKATFDTVTARHPAAYELGWDVLVNSAVVMVVARESTDPFRAVKEGIFRALSLPLNSDTWLTVEDIINILSSIPERRLILVIDSFASWKGKRFKKMNGLLRWWVTAKKIPLLFVDEATETALRQCNEGDTKFGFYKIPLMPLFERDVQELLRKGSCVVTGAKKLSNDEIVSAAHEIVQSVGGHTRSISHRVLQRLGVAATNDRIVYPLAESIKRHFAQVSESPRVQEYLTKEVFPAVAMASILGVSIDVRQELQYGLLWNDVLTGFPLPFYKLPRTDDSEQWKAQVGTEARLALQEMIGSMLISLPIKSLKASPTMAMMEDTLKHLIRSSAVDKVFENALVGAAILHNMLLDMMPASTKLHAVKFAMPFLQAVGVEADAPWPRTFDISETKLSKVSAYCIVNERSCGYISGDGDTDHAPGKAIFTESVHLIFQTAFPSGGLSMSDIKNEFAKMPTAAHTLYSEDGLRCLFFMASTNVAADVREIFKSCDNADLLVLYPGTYIPSSKGTTLLDNAEYSSKMVKCGRYLRASRPFSGTETIRVAEGHPQVCKRGRTTRISAETFVIPPGVRVVVINPNTKSTIWQQLIYVNLKDVEW